eukprot:18464-Heterococcus_DN1.PRE.2
MEGRKGSINDMFNWNPKAAIAGKSLVVKYEQKSGTNRWVVVEVQNTHKQVSQCRCSRQMMRRVSLTITVFGCATSEASLSTARYRTMNTSNTFYTTKPSYPTSTYTATCMHEVCTDVTQVLHPVVITVTVAIDSNSYNSMASNAGY